MHTGRMLLTCLVLFFVINQNIWREFIEILKKYVEIYLDILWRKILFIVFREICFKYIDILLILFFQVSGRQF